ncbi:MAG: histidinol-phosphate transaminase [Clostridia bacterium]|nr:histidinol-phosphate transaminase [Clostridia bacterium]
MSRFISRRFDALKQYVPGEQPQDQKYVKLNTNESPYPPAPAVIDRINKAEVENLKLYSDPDCRVLREMLALQYGVGMENVFVSNGSDESLSFAFMAFSDKDTGAVFPDISYGFYKVYAQLYGIDYEMIPLKEDLTIDPADYFGRGKTVVIANPNAPTGIALKPAQIEEIIQKNPDNVVVIDEAYVDFGGESVVPLTKKYDNLLVVQTFSKSRSMAGARLGFAIGSKALIADLNKIKFSTNPYNINRLTAAAGEATLSEPSYYNDNCKKIIETRRWTAEKLSKLGFTMTDSSANFLFAKSDKMDGSDLYRLLKEKGILVRHFDAPRISPYLRITIGTMAEMETLICALTEILSNGGSV